MEIGRAEVYEIQRLAMEVVAVRNTLRAGGSGSSKLIGRRLSPTVQQVLDSAAERLGNLCARLDEIAP